MKTTIKKMDYDAVMALPRPVRKTPKKPNIFWRTLINILSYFALLGTGFTYKTEGLEDIPQDQPCLILMNHTCFNDMEMAYRILSPRIFNVVASNDGFIGFWGLMAWLMRQIGCIPTQKFATDLRLVPDMEYCFKTLKTSVLMYPEACYSFDGTATTLPAKMGILLKKYNVPVIMIETFGVFARNPLYNELQIRKDQKISARAYVLFSQEDIKNKSVWELSEGVEAAFGFDHFKWQKDNGVEIKQDFRADGLHRILYKCTACGAEGATVGKGTTLKCSACGKEYELTVLGEMKALEGQTEISHIPDWYRWEREQVKQDLLNDSYKLDIDVKIAMQVDYKAVYMVGEGQLTHDRNGFVLIGCGGKLHYTQKPQACFGLYADYYWYEIGDIICIGDAETHYFLFPKDKTVSVAKIRLATEELYKLHKARLLKPAEKAPDTETQ